MTWYLAGGVVCAVIAVFLALYGFGLKYEDDVDPINVVGYAVVAIIMLAIAALLLYCHIKHQSEALVPKGPLWHIG